MKKKAGDFGNQFSELTERAIRESNNCVGLFFYVLYSRNLKNCADMLKSRAGLVKEIEFFLLRLKYTKRKRGLPMAKQTNRGRIGTVWRFGRKYTPLFLIAEVCILVSYAVALLLPLNLSRLTDQVLYGQEHELLATVIRDYGLLFGTATVFNLIYAFTWQTLQNHYVVDVKNEIFRKTIFAKASFLCNMNSGDIMSRIDGDAEQFIHVVQRNLFHFVNSILLCAGIIWMVARINPTIAVMLVAAAALPVLLSRLCGKLTQKYAKESREITGTFTGRLFEILKGFREIHLSCAGWWASSQVLLPLRKLIALGNRTRRVDFFVGKGTYFVNLTASLIIYGFSAWLIIQGTLTVGLFLAVIEYIALLHKKFNWMLRIYLDWFGRKVSIDRVNEILNTDSETDTGAEISAIETVEFRNVSFAYEKNTPVLEDVSFIIRKGERVAIAGSSGVGKTTLIGLMMGFYTPTSGEILINGLPMQQIKPFSLRRAIGMVSQDVLLFDETVRYNLQLGANYSDDALWEALEKAELKEIVEMLPEGLDSRISAARDLSGGQKQRLMLARLMLGNAGFIILDEATASLDVGTEAQITSRLRGFSENVTMLVISHRLAAIKGCERIIVLRDRTVDADGSHEDLILNSGAYRAMFGQAVLGGATA